jgi:hypothetical protein
MTEKVQRGSIGPNRATARVALRCHEGHTWSRSSMVGTIPCGRPLKAILLIPPPLSISTSVFRQVALQTAAAIGRNALVT